MPVKNNPPKSIFRALAYACQGLHKCWYTEMSFRLEVILGSVAVVLLAAVSHFIAISTVEFLLLSLMVLGVWVVELINSAVEAVVDRISSEHHPLSAYVKDVSAAAVLIAVIAMVFAWVVVLLPKVLAVFL